MYGLLRKEADVLWRENLARLRMQDMENAIFKQQRVEKAAAEDADRVKAAAVADGQDHTFQRAAAEHAAAAAKRATGHRRCGPQSPFGGLPCQPAAPNSRQRGQRLGGL